MISISKNLKETLIVIVIGLIITTLYFKPIIFEDKELSMHDANQGGFGNVELREYREKTGEEVLWTDRLFGGMPLYVTGVMYPSNWTYYISRYMRFLPQSADVIFFSFLGCLIMLLCLRISPIVAGIGAFAYAFNTFSIVSTEAGHIFKILAFAYTPLILGAIALVFRKKYMLGLALAALGVSLSLSSKHFQILYYFAFFGTIYTIYELVKSAIEKEYIHISKSILTLVVAVVIGIGPHISTLWSTFEYTEFTIRGKKEITPLPDENNPNKTVVAPTSGLDKEYAFAWSQGKWESLTLLIPYLYSGSSQEGYWGDQPGTAGPVYAGSMIIFLFLMYLVNIQNIKKYWIVIGGVFLLFLSWGRNFELFNYTMFDYFPMFNKFRSVSMAIIFTILALVIGAVFGLDYFIKQEKEEQFKTLKKASFIFFPLVILVYLATTMFADMTFNPGYQPDQLPYVIGMRKDQLLNSTIKVLFINALAFVVLLLMNRQKLGLGIGLGLFASLLAIDLISIDTNYLNYDSFSFKQEINDRIQASPANIAIMKDKSHYRVYDLDNPFNNNETSFFHNSIGGYDAAKMQRYQDLIERHISQGNEAVLAMLNTKYVIDQQKVPHKTHIEAGPAWFVSSLETVNNPDEEINYLNNKNFQPKEVAVVDKSKFSAKKESFSKGDITLDNYKPNHLTYTSNNSGKGLAVFSEVYYPKGWNAYIDGKLVDHFRVNYILRALNIPAGKHTIDFKFEPKSYFLGEKISLIFSILLVLIVVLGFGYELYKSFFTISQS